MLVWVCGTILSLVLLPCLVLVVVWLSYLRSATRICDEVGMLGAGAAGRFSLSALGDCEDREFQTVQRADATGDVRLSPYTPSARGCHILP